MVGEYDDVGQLIQEYSWKPNSVWMTDPLFTRTADDQVHYYLNDHLGTPQKAFRRNGKVTWKAQSSAFGETEVWDGSELRNNLRFPGQYFDAETGLHYNYFRDYAAGLGRYVQSDPTGLGGGMNMFGYSYQSPMNYMDVYGLWCNPTLAAAIAGAAGGAVTGFLTCGPACMFMGAASEGLTDALGERASSAGARSLSDLEQLLSIIPARS
ncbi:RHS repeat domain-containing protein [Endozoicomonas ascidiicola]|uniref:RHS repeat domain-containing protein n=1 Tax=Endozoicomonas ascidiicola TaxID=1698521 RepID=UPI000829AF29|nr:RHS repeat-associated core domain-containing protein [Endozoicomonas ascidiicola]